MVTVFPAWLKPTWMRWRGDLDAAAAGYLALDSEIGGREWCWAGQADSLEPVPLAGRDGAGQAAPQDTVLGDDVHDLAVEADAGALAC